jgi:hypothetical protein
MLFGPAMPPREGPSTSARFGFNENASTSRPAFLHIVLNGPAGPQGARGATGVSPTCCRRITRLGNTVHSSFGSLAPNGSYHTQREVR